MMGVRWVGTEGGSVEGTGGLCSFLPHEGRRCMSISQRADVVECKRQEQEEAPAPAPAACLLPGGVAG
jgi:hypothetical protein